MQKIHYILEFNQPKWLKPYFEFNTQKRTEVERNNKKNEKVLYKLMSDTIYGKAMQKLRNRIDAKLVNN